MQATTPFVSAIWPTVLQGFALGLGLIVAIGAQNAFVLRQGLRREHVGGIVLFCALADALLISAGVFGMSHALGEQPQLARALAFAGAAFLGWYAWKSFQRMRSTEHLEAAASAKVLGRGAAVLQAAAFTLLNPHVYLDTVLLVGGMGAQQPAPLQGWFTAGACSASFVWFASLGFGARWLAPVFAQPRAWQVLDALIGMTMATLSLMMLRQAL